MPLEFEICDGTLAWIKNPITGVVSYVVDLQDKDFAFTLGSGEASAALRSLDEQAIAQATASCPFCPGNEHLTVSPELMRLRPDQFERWPGDRAREWVIRVFNNLFPRIPPHFTAGRNESYIVVEDPRHFRDGARHPGDLMYTAALGPEHLTRILETCAAVTAIARSNPAVGSVVIRKNQGRESGASQPHPHQQIIGAPGQLPVLAAERRALAAHPRLWEELIDLAVRCDLALEADDDIAVYLSPIGSFPHSFDVVMPKWRGTLEQLDHQGTARFARALYRVLEIIGPLPLDYEIHQEEGMALHAHINVRRFPYSAVAGTINLPKRMLESVAAIRRRQG